MRHRRRQTASRATHRRIGTLHGLPIPPSLSLHRLLLHLGFELLLLFRAKLLWLLLWKSSRASSLWMRPPDGALSSFKHQPDADQPRKIQILAMELFSRSR